MMRRKNFALRIAALLLFSLPLISTRAFCGSHHTFPNQLHTSVNIGNPHHPEHPDHPDHPGHGHGTPVHFIPNSQTFWDFSKNWTTNYGPAYRDTAEAPSNFVECTGDYALCFESGPEPLPCRATEDGRFANCKCVVHHGPNFVLITAILNEEVYQKTIAKCGPDGSGCPNADDAPVCQAIQDGSLIPGAQVISTYSPDVRDDLVFLLNNGPTKPPLTICPKGPYAGCMTAPCKITQGGDAECSCPIFWGIFQLVQDHAQCTLDDDLVWSASYDPGHDILP